MSDLHELKERYRQSLEAFIQGDPEPQKALWSRRDMDASKFRERTAQLHFARGRGVPGRAWARAEVVWLADIFDAAFRLGDGDHGLVGYYTGDDPAWSTFTFRGNPTATLVRE